MERNYSNLIEKAYAQAVKGLKQDWFEKNNNQWYNYVKDLPEDLQIAYLISILDTQIYNGGFDQYFSNGYGIFAKETIQRLLQINASSIAALLSKAYQKLREECDSDQDYRYKLRSNQIEILKSNNQLQHFFSELDDEYYKREDDLEYLLGVYLYSKGW